MTRLKKVDTLQFKDDAYHQILVGPNPRTCEHSDCAIYLEATIYNVKMSYPSREMQYNLLLVALINRQNMESIAKTIITTVLHNH
jgi:hypothetical protein